MKQSTRLSAIQAMIDTEDVDSRFARMRVENHSMMHVAAVGALIIADGPDGRSLHSVYDDDDAGVWEYADEPDYSE